MYCRYLAGMKTVQVRNVPEQTHLVLRRRAAEAGMSLQEYLLTVLKELAGVQSDLQTADLRIANGSAHLWMAGLRNHRQDTVVEAFRRIADAAPWSYGLLHVYDDEARGANENRWVAWVMKRGSVAPEADPYLSPHVGVVEDDLDGA